MRESGIESVSQYELILEAGAEVGLDARISKVLRLLWRLR
jgi:hypothetical protein